MERKQLVRDVKREALARMEAAAQNEDDFNRIVTQWDHLDANRERRERDHEIGRVTELLQLGYSGGRIIPSPISHPYWREIMRGEFISTIYNNADEIWQDMEDEEIAHLIKNLTAKQKDVLFASAVRLCSSTQIALCKEKTDRAIRKLNAAALECIRSSLSQRIQERINAGFHEAKAKRDFLEWYTQKTALDKNKDG